MAHELNRVEDTLAETAHTKMRQTDGSNLAARTKRATHTKSTDDWFKFGRPHQSTVRTHKNHTGCILKVDGRRRSDKTVLELLAKGAAFNGMKQHSPRILAFPSGNEKIFKVHDHYDRQDGLQDIWALVDHMEEGLG